MSTSHKDTSDKKDNGVSRRDFFKLGFAWLSGVMTVLVSWPLFSFLIGPFYRKVTQAKFAKVPGFGSIPVGKPRQLSFQYVDHEAFMRQEKFHSVWVIKHSATQATVYSPICTHLGCHYDWKPERHDFVCPCHGSVFTIKGKVIGGPAPRPLDTLPYRIKDGDLYVRWEAFKPGIAKKMEIG